MHVARIIQIHRASSLVASCPVGRHAGNKVDRTSRPIRRARDTRRRHSASARDIYARVQPYVPGRLYAFCKSRTASLLHSLWYQTSRRSPLPRSRLRRPSSAPRRRTQPFGQVARSFCLIRTHAYDAPRGTTTPPSPTLRARMRLKAAVHSHATDRSSAVDASDL